MFFHDSDSNSSSSDGSRARSVQSSATHAPNQSSMVLDSDEPRRSFGIKVQNLPVRSTGELHILSQPLKDSNGLLSLEVYFIIPFQTSVMFGIGFYLKCAITKNI